MNQHTLLNYTVLGKICVLVAKDEQAEYKEYINKHGMQTKPYTLK